MATAPSVDDLQQTITLAWKTAGVPTVAPPAVVDSLTFFHPQDDFLHIALVDGHGGNDYRCGPNLVHTISHELSPAAALAECRIGEPVHHEGRIVMLVCRDGGKLPAKNLCARAYHTAPSIAERSIVHAASHDMLAAQLREHSECLQHDIAEFARHAALARVINGIYDHLATTAYLEQRLSEVRIQHTSRTLATLEECLAGEVDAMQRLTGDVRDTIEAINLDLIEHRALCDSLKIAAQTDSAYLNAERARLEEDYIRQMRSPSTILPPYAKTELDSIEHLLETDGVDAFCLQRRLHILKHQALHSARQPLSSTDWHGIVSHADTLLARLRVGSSRRSDASSHAILADTTPHDKDLAAVPPFTP